tara:strand:+ start:343 stop:567 length:225 start_codon:yes stop_codon:yes gene_type:complete
MIEKLVELNQRNLLAVALTGMWAGFIGLMMPEPYTLTFIGILSYFWFAYMLLPKETIDNEETISIENKKYSEEE